MSNDHIAAPTRDEIYRQIIVTLPDSGPIEIARSGLLKVLDKLKVDFEHLLSIDRLRAEVIQLAPHEDVRTVCIDLVKAGVAVAAEQNRVLSRASVSYGSASSNPIVNDPLYRHQWGLGRIGAEPAWLRARKLVNPNAPGILVAVIDTGIQTGHPDLVPHLWDDGAGNKGFNIIDGSLDVYDGDGHGTQLSGMIGAVSGDGVGIAAAEWPLRVMAIKFIDVRNPPTLLSAVVGILLATVTDAKIINVAWGLGVSSSVVRNAIDFAGTWKGGALVVAAAGNDGLDNDRLPTFPASYLGLSNLVSVMASDRDDDKAWFSNYGLTTVHLGAPGVRILTTDTYFGLPRWREFSGTSAACALVTYAAALIKTLNPGWSPMEIRDHLIASVQPSRWLKCISGGRLSLERAVLGPFAITAPAEGAVWGIGTAQTVTWTSSYVTGKPTTSVTLEISKNGGPYGVMAPGKLNNGSCPVMAPNAAVPAARLRIRSDQAPSFFAESPMFKVQ